MLWGSLQALNILSYNPDYFAFLTKMQSHLSIRRLMPDRISGMTYEPHWFAEQIILLLLPYALAAVLNNYSVFNKRWGFVTIEMLLLIWAIGLLPFTFSRAGLMNLVIVIILGLLISGARRQKKIGMENQSPSLTRSLWRSFRLILDYLSHQHANLLGRITKSFFFKNLGILEITRTKPRRVYVLSWFRCSPCLCPGRL